MLTNTSKPIFAVAIIVVLLVGLYKVMEVSPVNSVGQAGDPSLSEDDSPGSAIIEETRKLIKCEFLSTGAGALAMTRQIAIPSQPDLTFLASWLKPEAVRFGPPPRSIPWMLESEYTMGGKIPVSQWYIESSDDNQAVLVTNWSIETIEQYRRQVRARVTKLSYESDHIWAMFDAHPDLAKEKRVLILGSETPWAESVMLEYGARSITTVEFRKIVCPHPQITTYVASDFTNAFLRGKIEPFDIIFSFSSIEHDGLGRYGDILNPNGDLLIVRRMQQLLKPAGFLLLAVPCCEEDRIHWNAHRYYGPIRLAKLLAGWHTVDLYHQNRTPTDTFIPHPLWVLQNKFGCKEN